MEFQFLLGQTLKQDKEYQNLISKLKQKQQKCLKDAKTDEQQLQCKAQRNQFQTYLSEYTYQYREKGRRICGQAIKKQKTLDEKVKVKNQCVAFYHKSVDIFMGNVKDKLNSLVYNLDFSQL